MPIIMPKRIKYKPIPVKELLREMKDFASIMLDLAYYSILYADQMIAYEVLKIENKMDEDWSLVLMQTMLAARSPEDSEGFLSIARIATALDTVSDAAGDIANVTAQFGDHLSIVAPALLTSEEVVARIEINRTENIKTIGDLVQYPRHADVLVVIRDYKWFLDPSEDFKLEKGDKLILRGTEEAIKSISEVAGSRITLPTYPMKDVSPVLKELYEQASWLKNIADVALDLAFHSVVYNDRSSAIEVLEIEEEVDMKLFDLLSMVFRIKDLGEKEKIVFARLFESLEKISDAAAAMASVIVANLPVPEVIELAEEESNEVVIKTKVGEVADGKSIEQLGLDDIGAFVVAIKKMGRGWTPLPQQSVIVYKDDIIILKLYSEKDERLFNELEKRGLIVQEE